MFVHTYVYGAQLNMCR